MQALPDLNLLRVFDAIVTAGSLTRGGERLGLSQPATSNALLRLRRHFGDPLFVRCGRGLQPTERAQAMAPLVRQALELLDRSFEMQPAFEPAQATRSFHLCTTDVGALVLLPTLLRELTAIAPRVQLKVGQYPAREVRERFADGELDLAIGHLPALEAGIVQQRLFEDRYVAIARAQHPRLREAATAHALRGEAFVAVASPGTGHGQLKDRLEAEGLHVRLELREFGPVLPLVAGSDLLALVPGRLAATAAPGSLRVLEAPIELPPFTVRQFWHQRSHQDPANAWLRGTLRRLFGGGVDVPPPLLPSAA